MTPSAANSTASETADLLPEVARLVLPEHVLSVRWSADARFLASVPVAGTISVFDVAANSTCQLPAHQPENSAAAWHPSRNLLATCGQGNLVCLYDYGGPWPIDAPTQRIEVGDGWIESIAWNRDGSRLALGVGRKLMVFDPLDGSLVQSWDSHKSTVSDLAWNPLRANELASVCDGGVTLWRIGENAPFDRFDWGGASLKVIWSPDGRWIATGDQTPSVHIYDVPKSIPLHIQGYQTKLRALAWNHDSQWLATAGGESIILWPCKGKKGPNGAKPITLNGHHASVGALDFARGQTVMVSGAKDGLALLWLPLSQEVPALLAYEDAEITDIRFSPDSMHIAIACADGTVSIRSLSKFLQ